MKYILDADWSIDYLTGIRAARALFPRLAAVYATALHSLLAGGS